MAIHIAAMQAMVASGVNGLGLALVIPCLQSLTADFHPAESRGKAFGWMFCISSLGVQSVVCIGQAGVQRGT